MDAEKEPFLSLSACGVNAVSTVGNSGLTLYVVGCRLSGEMHVTCQNTLLGLGCLGCVGFWGSECAETQSMGGYGRRVS